MLLTKKKILRTHTENKASSQFRWETQDHGFFLPHAQHKLEDSSDGHLWAQHCAEELPGSLQTPHLWLYKSLQLARL